MLKGYKSFKLSVNDDAQIHTDGNLTWAASTVKEDAVTVAGKHELATLRWTVIFEKQGGKWMIVHEHTSQPLQWHLIELQIVDFRSQIEVASDRS